MTKKFSNGLSDAELERLAILSEEMSEANKLICKIIRHGYESFNPNGTGEKNIILLEIELGDVVQAMRMMFRNKDLSEIAVETHALNREKTIIPYLHFQEEERMFTFSVGDYIKYNHPNGSIGIITSMHPSVIDMCFVEYVYGTDIKGNLIKSNGSARFGELRHSNEDEYNKIANRKGFGDR